MKKSFIMWMLLGNEWNNFMFILCGRINMYPTICTQKKNETEFETKLGQMIIKYVLVYP